MPDEKVVSLNQIINGGPGTIIESTIKNYYSENHSPFTMIDVINDKTTRLNKPDVFDRFDNLSKAAILLFNLIKRNRDPKTNIAVMDEFNNYNKSKIRATYRKLVELQKEDLVLKVYDFIDLSKLIDMPDFELCAKAKKFSYMINPKLIHPKAYKDKKNYGPSLILWELLKSKKLKTLEEEED